MFLLLALVSLLFAFIYPLIKFLGVYITHVYPVTEEVNLIFFTFISFAILGLYDDIMKFFKFKQTGFFGLRMRHKFVIQWILALIISLLMFNNLSIDIFYVPFIGVFKLGWWFVPLAAFIIVGFTNAFNITDGLDGLAGGLLMICLFAFWFLSASILDTPLSVFLALWLGILFRIYLFLTL